MYPKPSLPSLLLLAGLASLPALVHGTGLDAFLGAPSFSMQNLWDGPGGTSVVVAKDGSVLAFEGTSGNRVYRSTDGGATWSAPVVIGADALNGNALVDEVSGNVLYVTPADGALWRSTNHGQTWQRQTITIAADALGNRGLDVRFMQPGITVQHVPGPPYGSDQRGRLIMPARVLGPTNSDAPEWRIYHYATAIYSDNGGASWTTSIPFPIMGAADGAIAELTYDGMVFSAREQITRGNRYLGVSPNNGLNWIAADRSADLPDGPRGSTFGLMGGLIRLPVQGYDVLLASMVDTDAGSEPAQFAGDSTDGRERISVFASFDGGKTWPLKRLVYDGPSGISNLAAGRAGTTSAGQVFLLFEGGPAGSSSAVQLASFNLSWLLDGRDVNDYLVELVPPDATRSVYWTGEGNRYGGQTNGWSTVSYSDPTYPVYGLASANGVSSGDTFHFVYDLARMTGTTASVRMNRDNVTLASLTLVGVGSSGFTFENTDNTGTGHQLDGPVNVPSGTHNFQQPTAGRTIALTRDSTWTIAEGATLTFRHVLAGNYNLTKSGGGTLLITGNQLHTGDTNVSEGVFGAGFGSASLAGNLYLSPEAKLRFNAFHFLTVQGTIGFEEEFGVANLDGLLASTAPGLYRLIAGSVPPSAVANRGRLNALPLGEGRIAHLVVDAGGLSVRVENETGEPPALANFEDWRMYWFGSTSDAGATAPTASYFGTGPSNLLGFALRLPPSPTVDPARLPQLAVAEQAGIRTLALDFRRYRDLGDVRLRVLASDDLANWTEVLWSSTQDPFGGGTNPFEDLRVIDVQPITDDPGQRRFLRLEVDRQ